MARVRHPGLLRFVSVAWIAVALPLTLTTSRSRAGDPPTPVSASSPATLASPRDAATKPSFLVGLKVTLVAAPPTGAEVALKETTQDQSGLTSVRFKPDDQRKAVNTVYPNSPPMEYFDRDRDLGQVFTMPQKKTIRLQAITLRAGPSKNAVHEGAKGAKVSLQFFEVTGTPVVHDNGTTKEKVIKWLDDPRGDDYLTGEKYQSILVARGGILPKDLAPDSYMRWELTGPDRPILEAGKRYAFLVMLDEPVPDSQFALANKYSLKIDPTRGSHGIRREGSVAEPWKDPTWNTKANCGLPKDFKTRTSLPPSTWGRPDVDTWRNLVFFLEGETVTSPTAEQ